MDEEQPFLKPIPCKWACVTPSSAEIQVLPHLLEGPDKWHSNDLFWSEKEKENKVHHPVGLEPKTSQVFTPKACALPLCYNCCPIINDNLNLIFSACVIAIKGQVFLFGSIFCVPKIFYPTLPFFLIVLGSGKNVSDRPQRFIFVETWTTRRWLKILPSVPGNR